MLRQVDLSKPPEHTVTDYAIKYKFPLDIFQEHAISAIDQGHNVLVCAKTGSGKTLCYIIPVLEILYRSRWSKLDGLGALIIVPTRELALQV